MTETLLNTIEIIITVIQSLIIGKFLVDFNEFSLKTRKNKICFLSISAVISITVILLNFIGGNFEGWIGLLYPCLYLALSLIFFEGNFRRKLIGSLAAITGIMAVNTIVFVLFSTITGDPNMAFSSDNIYRIIALVTTQVILVFIYQIIIKLISRHTIKLSVYEWLLISINLIFTLAMFISLILIKTSEKLTDFSNYIISGLLLGLILINCITFYMLLKLNKAKELLNENILLKQQSDFQKNYADNIKQQYDEICRLKHDIKHSYTLITTLNSEGKYEELSKYLREYNTEIDSFEVLIDTDNEYVNAIINTKLGKAKRRGINILCATTNSFTGISGVDLCSLLGNILDNAIEAAEKCTEPIIEVSIFSDGGKISITVKNTINSSPFDTAGRLITNKKEKHHGYGVKTIKRIAKEYNGKSEFYMEDALFCCYVVLKNK
ncbi:MAG: GHKL domain-containing protein [Oscillospiraceae bacterium]|nr:GHKL domain-containing protein [Oscillospiraceae bacterium]